MAKRRDFYERRVYVPYAHDAHQSIAHVAHNPATTYGIDGDLPNLHANVAGEIRAAQDYDRLGYDTAGLSIKTGRSSKTKFTGRN